MVDQPQPATDAPGDTPAVLTTQPGPRPEALRLPPVAPPANHGRTVAAWTTTVVVVLGALLAAVGTLLAWVWLFWVGIAVALAGGVVGLVLRAAGLGQGGHRSRAHPHG